MRIEKTKPVKSSARPRPVRPEAELKALLWPVIKRLPTYIRLGWALLREPAIAHRHKALLYAAIAYSVTPAHLVLSPVPVLGQIDNIVLLFLGLQQASAHCPPEVRTRHLARLKLAPTQLDRDLHTLLYVAWRALGQVGRPVGSNLRFAGRVMRGFSRRVLKRLAGNEA